MKKFFLILTAFFAVVSVQASIDARNFSSPQQEADYHALTQELRCPQCQNNNIADSNATIAVDMRDKVFELLQKGEQKQAIVDYMVQRYGNFVTYDPPLTIATIFLWLVPCLLVLLGILIIMKRKKSAVENSPELTEQQRTQLADILNKDQ